MKPNTQCARILRALSGGKAVSDGRWLTVPTIHRKAGTSRLNSRVSDLRKRGYPIEHRHVPGRSGAGAHQYRLLTPHPPIPVATEAESAFTVPYENAWPRDEENRYRIYTQAYDVLECVATCPDPESVGRALVTMGREGQLSRVCIGILDTHGQDEEAGEWLINPFDPGTF